MHCPRTNIETQFSRQINYASILQKLEKEITLYYQKMQKSVDAIGCDVSYLRQRFDEVYPSKLPQVISSSRRIPSKPPIFHGRDALVSELAGQIDSSFR